MSALRSMTAQWFASRLATPIPSDAVREATMPRLIADTTSQPRGDSWKKHAGRPHETTGYSFATLARPILRSRHGATDGSPEALLDTDRANTIAFS